MRWAIFIPIAYVGILLQTTVGHLLRLEIPGLGTVAPDLLAPLALMACLAVRTTADAMTAAWILGLLLDLTNGGGPNAVTVVGPMPLAYAVAAAVIHRAREAFFTDRLATQMLLGFLLAAIAHELWVAGQSALAWRALTWGDYGRLAAQAALVAAYTGLLTPVGLGLARHLERWLILAPVGRSQRRS